MAIGNTVVAARVREQASTTTLKTFLSKYFYLCMSLVIAGLVGWGFSRTVNVNLFHASPPRPLLLWMHGAAFSAWLVFFTVQSSLVRGGRVNIHRLLGWFGAGLATVMVVLGFTTAVVMTRFDTVVLKQKGAAAFLSIPFTDMIIFGVCIALAIYWKKSPEYHRRLIYIASCGLADAAIGRFAFWFDHNLFYLFVDFLIVLGMTRDAAVDGRIHKVYGYALPLLMMMQSLAVYLWRVNPAWWQGMTRAIVG